MHRSSFYKLFIEELQVEIKMYKSCVQLEKFPQTEHLRPRSKNSIPSLSALEVPTMIRCTMLRRRSEEYIGKHNHPSGYFLIILESLVLVHILTARKVS